MLSIMKCIGWDCIPLAIETYGGWGGNLHADLQEVSSGLSL